MDVLERVREINRDDTPVAEEQLNTARQALLRQIAKEDRDPARNRRRWAGATALVGGVAVTAIAINFFTPTGVDPAAAAVLQRAADVTINAIDTTLAPGQYLRIETEDVGLQKWDVDMGEPSARFNNGNRADAEAGFTVASTRVLYVPADRSSDWIWDWSADEVVTETYGDRAVEAISDWEAENAASDSGYWPDLQRLPGGEVPAAEGDDHHYPLDSYRPYYDEMPRDPQALLDWFRTRSGDPDVADQWVVDAISETLAANLMPADLRAATLRTLALIPGIQVSRVDGDATTLTYRSGDALSSRTTDITINTAQGMIETVAQNSVNNLQRSGTVPDEVPDFRTVITTTVVATAPQP